MRYFATLLCLALPALVNGGTTFTYSGISAFNFSGSGSASFTGAGVPVLNTFNGVDLSICHSCELSLATGAFTGYTSAGPFQVWDFASGGTFSIAASAVGAYLDIDNTNTFTAPDATGILIAGTVGAITVTDVGGTFSTSTITLNVTSMSPQLVALYGQSTLGTTSFNFSGAVNGSCPSCGFHTNSNYTFSGNAGFDSNLTASAVPEPATFFPCALLLAVPILRKLVRS
jgi:hypothetical protein